MLQQLTSDLRKAVKEYDLIEEGDKIAVGLSGGKDSMTLLTLLKNYQRFSPQSFELIAITLNLGDVDNAPLVAYCKEIDVPFYEVQTNIAEVLFDIRKEKNPCSLCAKLRRGILHDTAKKHGCNKVALGHHKDDAVETLLLSLSYEGRFSSFSPKTYLDRADLTLIRPMIYIEEAEIKTFTRRVNMPIIKNPCPVDGYTKRERMKKIVKEMSEEIPNFKKNLFHALTDTSKASFWGKE